MTRFRLVVDLEVSIDDRAFKAANLVESEAGVADVSVPGVRDAVTRMLLGCDWRRIGVTPVRSVVLPRVAGPDGWYESMFLVGDRGVDGSPHDV